MRMGYLDCFAGVAGDMWVGALLDQGPDSGLELRDLTAAVASLDLGGVEVVQQKVLRQGVGGTRFQVRCPAGDLSHRHLPEILEILARADLPDAVCARAQSVFTLLGEAEARVHDLPIEKVHFHEVGAVDTIVDVTCAVLGTHLLGIQKLYASAVAVGGGTVHCDHGEMPVPAPGALGNLFQIPVRMGEPRHECTTPTGAALLKVLVDEFEPDITWVPESTGYGAGSRDIDGHPNLLRITIGEMRDAATATTVTEVTCNLDTLTGEGLAYVLDGLLQRGAADAFATPVVMKKGRPGYQVTALVERHGQEAVVRFLLEESSTLGVRMHRVEREVLERWEEIVETDLGPVQCKVARLPSGQVVRRPEDDEVHRLVREQEISRQQVLARLSKQL